MLKLGKTPARPGAVKFKLSDYVTIKKLPKLPINFGHDDLIGKDWGMFGNDQFGDCVLAGAAHETLMWNKEAGKAVSFTDKAVLSDYSAITGFDPSDPATDNGTDMQQAASYRRKTGVVDAQGTRHQVAAYLALEPGNLLQHYYAIYLFGAVGIGIEFPASAMDQFNAGQPWAYKSKSKIEGGHYIPLVAKRKTHLYCVTWGKLQPMTTTFFRKYNDESIAYVSLEALQNNKSLEGFDSEQLFADLQLLK